MRVRTGLEQARFSNPIELIKRWINIQTGFIISKLILNFLKEKEAKRCVGVSVVQNMRKLQ